MFPIASIATVTAALFIVPLVHADVVVKKGDDTVKVEVGGAPFTELHFTGASHVYFWPVLGPGGVKMTREWPMADVPGEEHDHPHHRSLWFSHGLVNGVDFWGEAASYKTTPKYPVGKIEHDGILELKSGAEGVVKTAQKWIAPDGSVPIRSVETLRVYDRPATERMFDFQVVLTAGDKDAVFGDTKEGSFAMRIAESMRLKGPKGGEPGQGHMVSSEGLKDDKVWGTHAKWVDMSGPNHGKTLGIAIFDHPKNLRYPTRWHARDYGLFAANPFCEHDMDKSKPEGAGDYVLKAGQSLTFNYRIIIHEGDAEAAKIADRYAEYLKSSN